MVQAMININERSNKILNIIKAMYSLKNKSEALDYVMKDYEEKLLQPELRPEFIKEMKKLIKTADLIEYPSIKELRKDIEKSTTTTKT